MTFQKKEPLVSSYIKTNKNIVGINFDAVNRDRSQVGLAPLPNKTVRANEKTGEIPVRRKPKGSVRTVYPLRVSRYSKPRPIGVGDEKQVIYSCTTMLTFERWSDTVG